MWITATAATFVIEVLRPKAFLAAAFLQLLPL
jgi:hypothetical protein